MSSSKCTPAFNQETRDLMRERTDLARVVKAMDTGDFGPVIRAKARDLIDAGHPAQDVLAQAHAYVEKYAPHTREEVLTAINHVRRAPPTKTAAMEQRAKIKAELRDLEAIAKGEKPKGIKALFRKADPNETYNKMRATQLKKQLAELERRIRENDFAPAKRQTVHELSEANRKALEAVQKAKNDFLDAQLRDEFKKQGIGEKTGHFLLALQRFMIFSHITTLGKLTSAAGQRIVFNPIDDLAGSLLNAIPGYKAGISGGAPTEGHGFSPGAYKAALGRVFSKETLQDMRDLLINGQAGRDVLYSLHRGPGQFPMLEWAQRMHAVLKTPAKVFAFHESLTKQMADERDRMVAEGLSPEAIDTALQDPANVATMQAKAYAKSKRAILMQDNAFSDWFQESMRSLERKGGAGGRVAAFAAHALMPVVKIPSNFLSEFTSYTAGALALHKLVFKRGMESLTPEEKDYIARNLKKQTVGLAILALGYFGQGIGVQAGGYYDKKHQPKAGDPAFGGLQLFGVNIPRVFVHSPQLELLQLGATLRRYHDSTRRSDSAGHATLTVGEGIAEQVPLFSAATNVVHALDSPKAVSVFVGKEAASFTEPGFVQDIAKWTDPEDKRKPQGFVDALKVGIPELRETVPTHNRPSE